MLLSLSKIRFLSAELGLEIFGYLSREKALQRLAYERSHLESWQRENFFGEMQYMMREAELLTQLDHLLPNCRSVLCFSVLYGPSESIEPKQGYGRVSSYAWGQDYHQVLRAHVQKLSERLRMHFGSALRTRVFTDAVPFLERALGSQSQLGFIGKNSMLIRPGSGSYFFLVELLLDAEVEDDEVPSPRKNNLRIISKKNLGTIGSGCGACHACKTSCPTQAIVSDGVVDARRCISYLTIEKKSEFSDWEAQAIGSWIFGCDICQEVCPFNSGAQRKVDARFASFFSKSKGVGPQLSLSEVLSIRANDAFEKRFSGTPLLRAGREALLRNACAVAANTACTELMSQLLFVAQADASFLVRHQASTSLKQLEAISSGIERTSIRNVLTKLPQDVGFC